MSRPVACTELFFFSHAVSVSSVVALKTPNTFSACVVILAFT